MPAPTTRTLAPSGTATRRTVWIAQASGSTITALRWSRSSGTTCSWLLCATSIWLQPPLVSVQKPVWMPAETWPVVMWSQRLCWSASHHWQLSTPRGRQPSTGSRTTRLPCGMPGTSSRVSPTTSCPGVNGIEITADRYGELRPVSRPRSEPQTPDRIGLTRVQPSPGSCGSGRVSSRSGDRLAATAAAVRAPWTAPVTVRPAK